jgi:hypothetical protein
MVEEKKICLGQNNSNIETLIKYSPFFFDEQCKISDVTKGTSKLANARYMSTETLGRKDGSNKVEDTKKRND